MVGQGKRLHSRILRGLEALTATQAYNGTDATFQQVVMLSAGGKGVDKFWSTQPNRSQHFMVNNNFKMAALLRLRIVMVPDGAMCQIIKGAKHGDDDDKCL